MSARLIRGLSFAEYLAIDAVHFGTLKTIDTSPRHYQYAIHHERKDTDALRVGRVVHAMTLSPDAPIGAAIYPGAVRSGAAWKAFEEEHRGKIILRRGELETAEAMRDAIWADSEARELLSDGEGEVTITWSMMGMLCRGRLDWLRGESAGIVELKTTRNIGARPFERDFGSLFYHAQIALYTGALAAVLGRDPPELPRVIAVEKTPPHDVVVHRIGYDTLECGQRKVDEWIRTLAACRASQRWPGVGGGVTRDLRLPDWALADGPDVDLTGIRGGDDDGTK